ncbi:hypothetical protein DRP05_09230 [Archaeoglobales archaeon]|nr:MAG: hypothetical protein DRP05_09230 [Archaeoglobales archaeon]
MLGLFGFNEVLLFFVAPLLILIVIFLAIRYIIKAVKEKKTEPTEVAETIKKLAELHEQGFLTDEEFKERKRRLLGKL